MELDKQYYLAFINFIGINSDGNYIYRFDFTQDPESVWGDGWNFTPAGSKSKLNPEENTIGLSWTVISKEEFLLAVKNTCFSMQDCIDGIIPLMFSELPTDNILILRFGDTYEDVRQVITTYGLEISEEKEFTQAEDNIIDTAIDKLEKLSEDEEE